MKKSMIVLCGAAFALASFAEPAEAPAKCACDGAKAACECKGADCACEKAPPPPAPQRMGRRERPARPNRPAPTMLRLDKATTPEQIEDFKKQVLAKIDATVAAYAEKPGEEKAPTTIALFVNDRQFAPGMGPRGGQRGPGMGPRGGRRGPQGPRPEGDGAPAPAPAPAE